MNLSSDRIRTWHQIAVCGLWVAVLFAFAPAPHAVAVSCEQPLPVCKTQDAIFRVSAFDPVGSAVRISEDLLVTSRHIVADQKTVDVFLADGTKITAEVLPSDYLADAILLKAEGLPPGPVLSPVRGHPQDNVYTVGIDVGTGIVRAYDRGQITLLPLDGKPLARLHHTAYNQPGNSGGALVRQDGGWVGIVTSGGEGRFEAVPANAIESLKLRNGPAYADANAEIGAAVRVCTLKLEDLRGGRGPLNEVDTKALETSCRRTGNRQYFDLAAQVFGQRGDHERAVNLFEESLAQDPQTLNGRLGLVITYHLALRYEEELPHLRFLLSYLPEDLQVLRFALQAGVWGGDLEMARAALETLQRVNPNMAVPAKRFFENPPPRPKSR